MLKFSERLIQLYFFSTWTHDFPHHYPYPHPIHTLLTFILRGIVAYMDPGLKTLPVKFGQPTPVFLKLILIFH